MVARGPSDSLTMPVEISMSNKSDKKDSDIPITDLFKSLIHNHRQLVIAIATLSRALETCTPRPSLVLRDYVRDLHQANTRWGAEIWHVVMFELPRWFPEIPRGPSGQELARVIGNGDFEAQVNGWIWFFTKLGKATRSVESCEDVIHDIFRDWVEHEEDRDADFSDATTPATALKAIRSAGFTMRPESAVSYDIEAQLHVIGDSVKVSLSAMRTISLYLTSLNSLLHYHLLEVQKGASKGQISSIFVSIQTCLVPFDEMRSFVRPNYWMFKCDLWRQFEDDFDKKAAALTSKTKGDDAGVGNASDVDPKGPESEDAPYLTNQYHTSPALQTLLRALDWDRFGFGQDGSWAAKVVVGVGIGIGAIFGGWMKFGRFN
ncbi:hypothetical protein T439DRAFT_331559 [Meredithblackwellia eburnea MCA 4105]